MDACAGVVRGAGIQATRRDRGEARASESASLYSPTSSGCHVPRDTCLGVARRQRRVLHRSPRRIGRLTVVFFNALHHAMHRRLCAALDVFCQEPLPVHHPFWEISPDRLIISPHAMDQTDRYDILHASVTAPSLRLMRL